MTNIDNTAITQTTRSGRDLPMQNWIDYNQAMVRARIEALEAEAAAERLAKDGFVRSPRRGIRAALGHAMIRAGRAIAAEPHVHHPAHGRPSATA
jgi:hypothetical protein